MKNPYEDPVAEDAVVIGRRMAWLGIVAFLLFISLPPLLGLRELVSGEANSSSLPTLREKLRSFEDRFSGMELFTRWRVSDQDNLIALFREGNQRVLIGKEGWLYYRSDVDTVVGKGPRYEEPPSVARDPTLERWQAPLPVILDFAEQLEKRGIDLVLVPVPTKAMAVPGGLGATVERAFPVGYEEILKDLRDTGMTVVDPLSQIDADNSAAAPYLKQDTHWTPETMERIAESVARTLSARISPAEEMSFEAEVDAVERSHLGDLVGMLEPEEAGASYATESVTLRRVLDQATGAVVPQEEKSSVTILGDSFVNVFEDPALGFGVEGEQRIGAGFASHLAAKLGYRLQVIASNGGGATTVRQRFAESLAERESDPEVVVWVLSARDLFLPELPARRAGVEWALVTLPTERRKPESEGTELIVTATLRERSQVGDLSGPIKTPYPSAVYSTMFEDIQVQSGDYEPDEAWVFFWAFRDREPLDTAYLEVGKRYRLQMIPFPKEGPENKARALDNFFRIDLERYFAISAEEVK